MFSRVGYAPSLGMLRPANFVPRPLHDPAGEFAIVLYDPTIDDEPPPNIFDGMDVLVVSDGSYDCGGKETREQNS